MADVALEVDVDQIKPINCDWGLRFSIGSPDAAPPVDVVEENPQDHIQSVCRDTAKGSNLDELGDSNPDRLSSGVESLPCLFRGVDRVLDEIESTLMEDREEGVIHDEFCASDAAISTCKLLAVQASQWLLFSAGMKWAAFGEAEGGVSLVLRSEETDRRLDFKIPGDGLGVSAIRVDENLRTTSAPVALDDHRRIRECAAWVSSQA